EEDGGRRPPPPPEQQAHSPRQQGRNEKPGLSARGKVSPKAQQGRRQKGEHAPQQERVQYAQGPAQQGTGRALLPLQHQFQQPAQVQQPSVRALIVAAQGGQGPQRPEHQQGVCQIPDQAARTA